MQNLQTTVTTLATCVLTKTNDVNVLSALINASNALGAEFEFDHEDYVLMCSLGPVYIATNSKTTILMFMDKSTDGKYARSIIVNEDHIETSYIAVLHYFPCLANVEDLAHILSANYSPTYL